MEIYRLKSKAIFAYPTISVLVLSLSGAVTLATAARNLNSFEFLKFSAYVAIYGIATFGTSFSLEHQTTKGLASGSRVGNIAFLQLTVEPFKKAVRICLILIIAVYLLERFNSSGLYSDLYLPLVISVFFTFLLSTLRGWAAALHSPIYLANTNFFAAISISALPLLLFMQVSSVGAYLWGFSISPVGSISYLAFQLHRHNQRSEFNSQGKVSAAKIDSRLTVAYQGLAIVYLGSTLVLSNAHVEGEETLAAQAQLYLVGAKAIPQLLLGVMSLALSFISRKDSNERASQTRSWILNTLFISLIFATAAYLFMPQVILSITGAEVILDTKLIFLIFVSMILIALSLVFIPQFIKGSHYRSLGIIWWSAAVMIFLDFTPLVSNGLTNGVFIIFSSSVTSLILSVVFFVKISRYSQMANEVDLTSPNFDTKGIEYTHRLVNLESKTWKRLLDVQAPYRWNLSKLNLGRTLDVGCGVGRNLKNLPNSVGVDHNLESIEIARSHGLKAYTTAEWKSSVDATFGSFDSILLAHVLEHLTELDANQVIQSYLPYLKLGGKIVLICPQEKGFPSDPTHIRWVDAVILHKTGSQHGFREIRNYSFPFPRPFGRVFKYNESVYVGVLLATMPK